MATGYVLMTEKPTYNELEHKINKLEKEALECMRKEKEFNEERRLADYGHIKRTISLMKINEELNREIKEIKRVDKEELVHISDKLRGRIKELDCLYDISNFRENNDFSLDGLLQEIVNFIPPACKHPEITCARIILDQYEFTTKNFKDTKWKLSQEIKVNSEQIGALEVCYLEEKSELAEGPFLNEARNLITAIAESIAQIVEREWAEIEIRKCRNKIEELLKHD